MRNSYVVRLLGVALTCCAFIPGAQAQGQFTPVGPEAGVDFMFDFAPINDDAYERFAGGVAAADFNRDGHIDLYLLTGDLSANRLLRNRGDGTFEDVTEQAGASLGLDGHLSSAPVFADINSDGWPDLFVGGIRGWGHYIFLNQGDGTFSDHTEASGIFWQENEQNEYSAAFGDPDRDGDLDLFVSHWGARSEINHFWLNDGSGRFHAADQWTGYRVRNEADFTFTPTFADVNADGWQDMLLVADFGRTQLLINEKGLAWQDTTDTDVITDESGMGSAVADFDNDGDLDWFVTAIHRSDYADSNAGTTGNRLYINDGKGVFSDGTESAGVREGSWGWGACAADFNNDGWLDIFHVNGMPLKLDSIDFNVDRSVLFMNQKDGSFTQVAAALGVADTEQGRGIVCFDYDNDGDTDILVQNWKARAQLYRNDLESTGNWLQLDLHGEADNPSAVGAVIELTAGGVTQMREITIGSNFASNNPLRQHFGLGEASSIDSLKVRWPHGGTSTVNEPGINQRLTLLASEASPPPFKLEAGHSAAWFDPERNGEGFLLEVLPGNVAVAYWFTYDLEGGQHWYVAVGQVENRRIVFPELIRTAGGEFGPGFDPARIERVVVGSAAFTWNDCDSGFMDWFVEGAHGRQTLNRLTTLDGLACGQSGENTGRPEGKFSGSWFDPTHNGEGFIVQMLSSGEPLMYWFSYSPQGDLRWFFGVGEIKDDKLIIDPMYTTHGARFGAEFNSEDVNLATWGSVEMSLECNTGTVNYTSSEGGFGQGNQDVIRLTTLAGLSCD